MSQKPSPKTILLCAGGTGGHLFPAIALGQRLKSLGWNVFLMTDLRGASFVPSDLFQSVFVISSGHLTGSLQNRWKGFKALLTSFKESFVILRRLRPQILWGFGGAVSFAPLLWGFLFRIPSGIYQADAILGRANRCLLPFTQKIATGFQSTLGLKESQKNAWVGFPVRDSFGATPYPLATPGKQFQLLVLGGSQGAQIFSQVIPKALSLLDPTQQIRITVVQQCRPQLVTETEEKYRTTCVTFSVVPFVENVAEAMQKSHLVITRAGASTIGELARVGRPALLVPYPHATQDHQTANARLISEVGGAEILPEDQFTPATLAAFLQKALSDPFSLKEMASQIQFINRKDTVGDLVVLIEGLLSRRLPLKEI